MTDSFIAAAKDGTRSIVMFGRASDCAQDIADLINACVDMGVKVQRVETPSYFEWKDIDGKPVEINNILDNKAIFTFTTQ